MWADDVVMSRMGRGRAKTHDIGPVLRCRTYHTRSVALHRMAGFDPGRREVLAALAAMLDNERSHRPDG